MEIDQEVLDYLSEKFFNGAKLTVEYREDEFDIKVRLKPGKDIREIEDFCVFTGACKLIDYCDVNYNDSTFSYKNDRIKKLTEAVKKMIEQEKFEEIKNLTKICFNLDVDCKLNNSFEDGPQFEFSFSHKKSDEIYSDRLWYIFLDRVRKTQIYHEYGAGEFNVTFYSLECDKLLEFLREEKKRRDMEAEQIKTFRDPICDPIPDCFKSMDNSWTNHYISVDKSPPRFSKQTRQELKAYRQKLRKLQAKIQKRMANVDALIGGEDE